MSSGKVSVGGDGDKQIPYTSRTDIARYISYVLTHLPTEQLENRSFRLTGDTKVRGSYVSQYRRMTKRLKTVVQRDIQSIRSKDWEKGRGHLHTGF
jgi:hypothetical protein